MFVKFAELNWYVIAILVVLVGMFILLYARADKIKWNSRKLANAAMCIAIAFVLSMIRLFRMPQGGSVTPASMLPIIMLAMATNPTEGLIVGGAYGILQLLQGPSYVHPIQILVDYPMAYGAIALACLAKRLPIDERFKLPVGVIFAYFGRYVMAVLSGAVFFAEYAGEQNAVIYSLAYNISYLGIEAAIAAVIAFIPGMKRISAMLKR